MLINKLDIRDETDLNEAEALITLINAAKLEESPMVGSFDFEHYKAIRRFLFSDLYECSCTVKKQATENNR